MSELILQGTLIQILKPESGVSKSGKEWKKQDFVIQTNEQFQKNVCLTLFGDKVSLIEEIAEGSEIEVFFNVESREFNGKWYHNLNVWKVNILSKSMTDEQLQTYESPVRSNSLPPTEYATQPPIEDDENDLPF
jgi:hypothetical protein